MRNNSYSHHLASVPAIMLVGKDFTPQDDRSEFNINLKAAEGTSPR
jgi:multidrug efflux pump subunit AcrB